MALVLAFGQNIEVQLQITTAGHVDWPDLVIVAAGSLALACYAFRVGVPRRTLLSVVLLGALTVVLAQGMTPVAAHLSRNARTLLGAVVIGVLGRLLAHRLRAPGALWMVPAILPLLPAPATLLPLLAQTEAAHHALQGQALETAFVIGVGVAPGDIIVATYLRYRERVLEPLVDAVAEGIYTHVVQPVKCQARRWWRRKGPATERSNVEYE